MKKGLKKYFSEGVLIVFSVLFALFINRMSENYSTQERKKVAIENIKKELKNNYNILKGWQKNHTLMNANISKIVEGKNDSLKEQLNKGNYLNFGLLTNGKSLINSVLSDTAWETAKATNIISEFDFNTIQKLTQTYKMQHVLSEKTILNITNLFFSSEAHQMDKLDNTLLQFSLRFNELVGQEQTLDYMYKNTLEFLNK
ncbi:MAG: hypothetical protein ACPGUU_09575 [Flavobacteriaceae bacterium]